MGGRSGGGTTLRGGPPAFFDEAQHLRQLQQRKQMQIEINTAMYDKGATYSTLIFAAGYAGYFAIWDWVREYMTRMEMLTSALLIGISLALFIFWQVYTMYFMSKQNVMFGEVVTKPDADFDAAAASFNIEIAKLYARYTRAWRYVFWPTTGLGVVGAAFLLSVVAGHLFSGA